MQKNAFHGSGTLLSRIILQEVREKYISNPPEGMTSEDIRHMSEDDLLDMDCFLNEDVFGDDFGEEGFYIF